MAKKKPGHSPVVTGAPSAGPKLPAHTNPGPSALANLLRRVPVQLLILAFLSLVLRLNLIDIPLERDEGAYAILGKMAMEGLAPYRDFYEMKPPFIFYAYGVLVSIFGYSHAGLHWAAWLLCFLIAANVYWMAGVFLGAAYRFWGGLVFTLLISNPYTTSVFLESELVILAVSLPGINALLTVLYPWQGALSRRTEIVYLAVAGFLVTAAMLVKQTGLYFWAFAVVAALIHFALEGKDRSWKTFFHRSLWFAGGTVVALGLCALIIQGFGVWKEFWFWNVDYIRMYSSTISNRIALIAFELGWKIVSRGFVIYWIAALAGFLALWGSGISWQKRWTLLALLVFSFLAVAPGKRFYHHYWLLFLPAIALMITVFVYAVRNWLSKLMSAGSARVASVGLVSMLLIAPFFQNALTWVSPRYERLMAILFPGNPFMEDKILADFLSKRIQPGEEIAVLGSETPYYIYLDRQPLTRHFYTAFLMRPTEFAEKWQQEALDTLIARKPEYVVFNFMEYSWMQKDNSPRIYFNGSYRWCTQEYEPIGWVFYHNKNQPEIVLDSVAVKKYAPLKDGTPFIMLMQRKKVPQQ